MLEFKINEYITLKLEHNQTVIYVKNERFNQCKKILFTNPHHNEKQKIIDSIDEAVEILSQTPPLDYRSGGFYITPETEFWAHCSNLDTWSKRKYDTRLLHRTLAYPILKVLTEVVDQIAKAVFKEEIIKRFENGHPTIIRYLIREDYIRNYAKNELIEVFLESVEVSVLKNCKLFLNLYILLSEYFYQ